MFAAVEHGSKPGGQRGARARGEVRCGAASMSREGTLGVPDIIGDRDHRDSGQSPLVGAVPGEVGDDDIFSWRHV